MKAEIALVKASVGDVAGDVAAVKTQVGVKIGGGDNTLGVWVLGVLLATVMGSLLYAFVLRPLGIRAKGPNPPDVLSP